MLLLEETVAGHTIYFCVSACYNGDWKTYFYYRKNIISKIVFIENKLFKFRWD